MALEVLNTPAVGHHGDHSRRKAKRLKRSPRSCNESDDLNLAGCLVMLATGGGGGGSATPITAITLPATSPGDDKQNKHFECNICGKVLSSYQALGGHKTTHREKSTASASGDQIKTSTAVAGRPTPGGRVHECSICNKTFLSGQALGGHKRKHYEPNKSGTTTVSSSDVGEGSSGVAVSYGGAAASGHIHGEHQRNSVGETFDFNVPPSTGIDLTLRLSIV